MVRKPATAQVTSKGQVTIPQEIRRRLGLRTGDRVEFVAQKRQTVLRRAKGEKDRFAKYVGILPAFRNLKEINSWISEMRDPD